MRSAASNSRGSARPSRRAGETLVECLVALAFAATVFPAAAVALRAAVRRDADTAARLAAAVSLRPAALSACTRLRGGEEIATAAPSIRIRDADFADALPDGFPVPRIVQIASPAPPLASPSSLASPPSPASPASPVSFTSPSALLPFPPPVPFPPPDSPPPL